MKDRIGWWKRVPILVLSIMLGTIAAACGKEPPKEPAASDTGEKETLILATLDENHLSVEKAVTKFNQENEKYQIEVKFYLDDDSMLTEEMYLEAITKLNLDLTGSNPPDLIDLTDLDIHNLAEKDVLEDLTSYLESSTVLSEEDFVPVVLAAYTINDKLVTIPKYFGLETMIGKTSVVGEKQGWTMQEVLELAKKYPDAKLLGNRNKNDALMLCLKYSIDSFIDYENCVCSFDSKEFWEILEFANSFDGEYSDIDGEELMQLLKADKILLENISVWEMAGFRQYSLMFGGADTTCIGYPTSDGSAGVFINAHVMYGIHSKSEHTQGAWQFFESLLAYEEKPFASAGFSVRVDKLEEGFTEAMQPDFPYVSEQKHIDEMREMIAAAKPIGKNSNTICNIISEEAAAYFAGEKSAVEVAEIIQSRVEIYVSENS